MNMATAYALRRDREDWANVLTHGLGLIFSLGAGLGLVWMTVSAGDGIQLASACIYVGSLVFLYAASTFYHFSVSKVWKSVLRLLDHVGVYVLIAGTYTPFALVTLRGGTGWTLFAAVWGMALIGTVYKLLSSHKYRWFSTVYYLFMGWFAVFFLKPMAAALPFEALVWIAAGGIFYSAGVVFFAWEKMPFNHSVWHLFVLAGSTCHFVAVARYVLSNPPF